MKNLSIKYFQDLNISEIIDSLLCLDRLVFGKYEVWNKENFSRILPGKDEYSCVVYDGDSLIGFMIAYLSEKHTLHLSRIAVLNEYRGTGIGKLLLEKLIADASINKLKCITLEFEFSLKVKEFYEKFGFVLLNGNDITDYLKSKNKFDKAHYYTSPNCERGIMVNRF